MLLAAALTLFAIPAPSPLVPRAVSIAVPIAAQDGTDPALAGIADSIDGSVRWLRTHQDPKTGSYGGDVSTTALVLRAMHDSPRAYVRADGPFIDLALDYLVARQDAAGWIADEGAPEAGRVDSTLAAARALFLFVDPQTTPAVARAVAWLGEQGVSDPSANDFPFATTKPEAQKIALRLLASRREDGSWDGPEGAMAATARNVLELSTYVPLVRPPKKTPTSAHPLPPLAQVDRAAIDAALVRGARFLLQAAEDGKWGAPGRPDAGLTAMVLGGLQSVPEPRPEDVQSAIDAGLAWLLTLRHDDGSISQGRLANYVTSAAVLALAGADREEYAQPIARARDFLVSLQADEAEGYSEDHPFYGGIGYGDDERPDLSNLQMALEALVAADLDRDDAAFARAVKFLERCQNRSESNDFQGQADGAPVRSGNDGGAAYQPGVSKAGFAVLPDGTKVPRSYGSMTYALLKGFVFAGLSKDDPRVEAAWKWICENYTLDVNPGFETSSDPTAPYQGLFYYFHSMARALAVYGDDTVTDGAGVQHAWRAELAGRLLAMQSKLDGSWVNENAPRWWEGNPVLATAYALMVLRETR